MKYICLQKKGIKYAFINSFGVKEMEYQEFKLYQIFAKLFSFSEKAIIIHFYYSFALHIPLCRMIQETLKLLVPEHAVPTWTLFWLTTVQTVPSMHFKKTTCHNKHSGSKLYSPSLNVKIYMHRYCQYLSNKTPFFSCFSQES